MQSVLIDNIIPYPMPEKPIDVLILKRVDDEQKETASRVRGIDQQLQALAREVSEIKGLIRSSETPAWIRHFVYPACLLIASSIVAAVIALLIKVNGIETFIHDNGGFIAGLRLQQSATDPKNLNNVVAVQQVLQKAKRDKITIPVDLVEKSGTKFLEVSANDPKAWDAVTSFLDYRSFLASLSFTLPEGEIKQVPPSGRTVFAFGDNLLNWKTGSQLQAIGYVDNYDLPQAHLLSRPDTNAGARIGPNFLLLSNADLILDGLYLKKVIIRDSHIIYRGGSVSLQNVHFVNCTFEIVSEPTGRSLAEAVLESPTSVMFKPS